MIDAHRNAFIEETTELLSELESSLLELEETPEDSELIARVFRALHTIKGSSGMFGYDDITMFTHDIENVYDHIRNGEIKITKQIIDLTLAARDQISSMLKYSDDKNAIDENVTKDIISSFRLMINDFNSKNKKEPEREKEKEENKSATPSESFKVFHINFKPAKNILFTGTNPVLLVKEVASLGRSVVLAEANEIPSLDKIEPENCYVQWDIILKTTGNQDSIKDVFIFIEDQCELEIKEIETFGSVNDESSFADFEEFLVGSSLQGMSNIGELIQKYFYQTKETLSESTGKTAFKKLKDGAEGHSEPDTASSIRVSAEKLDELVNLVGELVTIQARLSQIALTTPENAIVSVSEEVERITWSLRDSALNIRMLPIGTTFSKFKRLVRDLSRDLKKEVELNTEGAETELDKTVIEKLNDPLIHIIRNSLDHGIEIPEEREKAGKPRTGTVMLSASQSGGNVLIKISDDGAGMDKDVIKEKAVRLGLIAENAELSENEIFSLVFAPGFSTAQKITNVSGRGVGMDVVKRAIENLRGSVEVSSAKGKGTTITLRLPLTLAIIDGLLVQIQGEHYVLPLSAVEECIELSKENIQNSHGREIVNVRGNIVPYINLRSRFKIGGERPEIEQIVIAEINGTKVGFVVDKVFGQHQTVLKTLGRLYRNVDGISGATILGDGTVALILDINKLLEKEEFSAKSIMKN